MKSLGSEWRVEILNPEQDQTAASISQGRRCPYRDDNDLLPKVTEGVEEEKIQNKLWKGCGPQQPGGRSGKSPQSVPFFQCYEMLGPPDSDNSCRKVSICETRKELMSVAKEVEFFLGLSEAIIYRRERLF